MKYRKIGSSSLEVSEVGLGTWALGGPVFYKGFSVGWRPITEAEARSVIRTCAECGVNFIDTADIYGNGFAETVVGKALREMGEAGRKIIVATKAGFIVDRDLPIGQNQDFSEAHLRRSCENSLRRLHRDVIDLYQLHNVPLQVIREGECFEVLRKLQKEGKIREFGVSIVTTEEALAAVEVPGLRSIQVIFNMFRQKPIRILFPKALKKGVGILARVPLASGLLTGKFKVGHAFEKGDHRSQGIPGETFSGLRFVEGLKAVEELRSLEQPKERTLAQAALQFTLRFEAVSSVIPGAVTPAQLMENARAGSLPRFPDEDFAFAEKVYEKYCKAKMEKLF